jgi:hypothetical protein
MAPGEARDMLVQSVETPSDDQLADAVGKLSAFLCMEEFSDSRNVHCLLQWLDQLPYQDILWR